MKRYAIVRVDSNVYCLRNFEKHYCSCKCDSCYDYGDTKEQLIRKVQTAIERLKNDKSRIVVGNDMWAKFIVEFLGVE